MKIKKRVNGYWSAVQIGHCNGWCKTWIQWYKVIVYEKRFLSEDDLSVYNI